MLIKRNDIVTSRISNVKKLTRSSLAILAMCTAAIAPHAFAGDSLVQNETVTVKFQLSEFQSEGGTNKVYTQIKKRAKSYCRANSGSLQFYGESKRECTDDLIDQFIQNADIDILTEHHFSQKPESKVKKVALNLTSFDR